MTKNTGKGGKGFRKGKSAGGGIFRRELLLKEDGQEYAKVTKILGNGHVECSCFDNIVRLGNIRGKMRRRIWIVLDDIVLCGLRDYQDGKADIIHKYNPEEIRNLRNIGELPEETKDLPDTTDDISGVLLNDPADNTSSADIDFSTI
jgi:translation initiation factor 1A